MRGYSLRPFQWTHHISTILKFFWLRLTSYTPYSDIQEGITHTKEKKYTQFNLFLELIKFSKNHIQHFNLPFSNRSLNLCLSGCFPESPCSPYKMIVTLASVPAPFSLAVITTTSYWMGAKSENQAISLLKKICMIERDKYSTFFLECKELHHYKW